MNIAFIVSLEDDKGNTVNGHWSRCNTLAEAIETVSENPVQTSWYFDESVEEIQRRHGDYFDLYVVDDRSKEFNLLNRTVIITDNEIKVEGVAPLAVHSSAESHMIGVPKDTFCSGGLYNSLISPQSLPVRMERF